MAKAVHASACPRRSALPRAGSSLAARLLLTTAVLLCSSGIASAQATRAPTVPATRPPEARVSEHLFGLPGLWNIGRIAPGVYRGAQPTTDGYRTLKGLGVRTVVNLRVRHTEKQAVESAGMRSIEIPISTTSSIDAGTITRVLAVLRDPANQPVFVHCARGQDRTGVVVAVYRMEVDGWTTADAEAEMQSFGFNDAWIQMKQFVRRYRARTGRESSR